MLRVQVPEPVFLLLLSLLYVVFVLFARTQEASE